MNCGHEQEEHNPNLVNEPAEGDYAHIETAQDGYPMCILLCMETSWSPEYTKQIGETYWGDDRMEGIGYVSPDPKKEAALFAARPTLSIPTSVLIVFYPRLGYSIAHNCD